MLRWVFLALLACTQTDDADASTCLLQQSVFLHTNLSSVPIPACKSFESYPFKAEELKMRTVPVTDDNIVYHSGKVLVVRHRNLYSLVFLHDDDDGSCAEESLVECASMQLIQVSPSLASDKNSICRHACVADAKPHLSMFRSMISGALNFHDTKISRALMLGLGAGAIPLWFSRHMPNTDFYAVDINGDVVRAAPCFGLHESSSMHLIEADGLAYAAEQAADRFEVVFVDVFDGEHVPAPFTSVDFFRNLRRILSPQGVMVLDIYLEDVQQALAAVSHVFPEDEIFIGKSPGLENTVLLAGGLPNDRRTSKFINHYGIEHWLADAKFHTPAF
mmetsp:Transcript_64065/g.111674  ORF Transcript_64065/g.111674 Transcript_64065/m.111674 type:complete len:333 (-) Transcript_64065:163-1161(-)